MNTSVNNIYLVVVEKPFKRYVKTIPSRLGGMRLDADGKETVSFILQSKSDGFDYESEVLEIYTDREDRFIRQVNKGLFRDGYLREYVGDLPEVDVTNMLSDEEVTEVASMRNIQQLQKRLSEFTSPLTMRRIYDAAQEIGRPSKTLALIKARLDEMTSGEVKK